MNQLTTDFEARFRRGDTPWEDPHPWHGLEELLRHFVPAKATVLDVVFDRGCFHGFADGTGRSRSAAAVAAALKPVGLWIDISGSSDNGDPPERVRELGLPRLTLADMALAIEPYFETVAIRADVFGHTPYTDFRAFVGVFRRR
jgi:hypothetical protein